MKWIYYDPKNSDYLIRLSKHSGFFDLPALEKLVLDFETHYLLKDKFEMMVKGGMAALLHAGPDLQRISEDIDVMTTVPQSQIASILDGLHMDEAIKISIQRKYSRLPDHLIHCEVKCPSSTSHGYCTAKMDILCGIDPRLMQYSVKMTSPRLETLDFVHNISVLSRGALIADKMCTLTSAETVGLRSLKDFPKQVHDVAMLLRGASVSDLQAFFRAYGHFASFEIGIHRQACSHRNLIDGAHDRCVSLLDFGESALLSPEYHEFYTRFQSRYVKNNIAHTAARHTDEILLAILCARHLREHDADGDLERHSRELHGAIRSHVRVGKSGKPPAPDPVALGRIGREHPNLANPGAQLTASQWALLLEAFAPLLA